jgi:excisionase family DNA binding protein
MGQNDTLSEPRQFYSVNRCAAILDVSRSTIFRWIRDGRLEAVRIGDRTRIEASALDAFIDRGRG